MMPRRTQCSRLHTAIQAGYWEAARDLAEHNNLINTQDKKHGNTPLHIAVSRPDVPDDIVTRLITSSNINTANRNGETALHVSAQADNWAVVAILLQHGAAVNTSTNNRTILQAAAGTSRMVPANVINRLVAALAPGEDVNHASSDGKTALHLACEKRKWGLVARLLQMGADVNIQDKYLHYTPLHAALVHDNVPTDTAAMLCCHDNVNLVTGGGTTALHLALNNKKVELVELLLDIGADKNISDNDMRTPLHMAARHLDTAVMEVVTDTNINEQDSNGNTALHIIVRQQHWHLVHPLIEQGADINMCNNWNEAPLHVALGVKQNDEEAVKLLITSQNVNIKNYRDLNRALGLVAVSGSHHLAQHLAEAGAQFNLYDLVTIIIEGHYSRELMQCLLKHCTMHPLFLTKLEIACSDPDANCIVINGHRFYISVSTHPISLSCALDMVCYLLQQLCIIKHIQLNTKTSSQPSDIDTHVAVKYAEFSCQSSTVSDLKRLCILSIRSNMQYMGSTAYSSVRLPPGLLRLVTWGSVGEGLDGMWERGVAHSRMIMKTERQNECQALYDMFINGQEPL